MLTAFVLQLPWLIIVNVATDHKKQNSLPHANLGRTYQIKALMDCSRKTLPRLHIDYICLIAQVISFPVPTCSLAQEIESPLLALLLA